MPKRYFLNENGQRTGPFTIQELEQRYRVAEIDGDTLCWPDEFFSIGWKQLRTFFPHFRSPTGEQEQRERQEQERADHERRDQQRRERERQEQERRKREAEQNPGVAFDCVDCGTAIRLRLQQSHAVHRCPSCKTEYKAIQSNGEQPVFLVLPTSRHRTQSSDTPPKRKRPLPPEVRAALTNFGLGEEATFDDVRRAYREHVKQYHPDMVAHLGTELRKVAEMKTKEFNSAYQTLERFYAPLTWSRVGLRAEGGGMGVWRNTLTFAFGTLKTSRAMKKKANTVDLDFNSVPWPHQGDTLFRDDADWSDNAFLNLGGKEWESYASGYKEAADVLVERFLKDWRGMDIVTYPIVFLYHHHIELRLKQLIIAGQALLRKPIDFQDQHSLLQLWRPCRQILCEIWPQEPAATWDAVERLLNEFDQRDPDGMCCRYPVTTKKKGRQPTIPKLNRVGVRNLHEVMQRLASFFEAHLDGVDV